MSNSIQRDKNGRILKGSKGLNLSMSKGELVYRNGEKLCSRCKAWKKPECFYKRNTSAIGLESNCKECSLIRKETYKKSIKYSSYKRGAKDRGFEFKLTKEEFESFWQKPCAYCGDSIETIGLDRVDNHNGYVPNNIAPCCTLCNTMKRALPKDIFISHCKKIARTAD